MDHEVTVPSFPAGSVLRAPALRCMPRYEEVRSDQTTTGADQALDERRGDPERRVRHHFEGTARESETGGVGANDRHVALTELIPQVRGALWMQFNRNDARTGGDERASYRSSSRTDVENKVTGNDAGVCDEAGAPNDYRVDATPTLARGSRTRRTITMKQVMGATVIRFLRPVIYMAGSRAHRTTSVGGTGNARQIGRLAWP